ncbi:MAG: class I SAM-dependent methyltransferase [Bacteriovorax sp.]
MRSLSFHHLSDFKSLAEMNLSKDQRESLLNNPHFFYAPDRENYQSIQDHSEYIDKIIGFKINEIETKLKSMAAALNPEGSVESWGKLMHEGSQSWVGLNPRQLLTPYDELIEMLHLLDLRPNSRLIDLGAGYGRMAFAMRAHSLNVSFLGYEIVEERVNEGQRLFDDYDLSRALMSVQDLSLPEFVLPVADYYLIYDYGTIEHIKRTLNQLQEIARKSSIKIIARGKTRHLIQSFHPWLAHVHEPIHKLTYSLYSNY